MRKPAKPKMRISPQEKIMAENYAATGNTTLAARAAGYSYPDKVGATVLKRPAVQETVRQIQERRIMQDLVPQALSLLETVMKDTKMKPEVRIRAAQEVRQWSQQIGVAAGDKAPEDMTPNELADRIAALRAKQAQLAEGAKVIDAEVIDTAAVAAASDVQGRDIFG